VNAKFVSNYNKAPCTDILKLLYERFAQNTSFIDVVLFKFYFDKAFTP